MRRREFIRGLGGAAAAWPLTAHTQQPTGVRRIGVLMGLAETDPFTIQYVQELRRALQNLGWRDGQNIRFGYRYAGGNPELHPAFTTNDSVFATGESVFALAEREAAGNGGRRESGPADEVPVQRVESNEPELK